MPLYTIEEIEQGVQDNVTFEETNDAEMAARFISYATLWLMRQPNHSGRNGTVMTMDKQTVVARIKRAEEYVDANPTTSDSEGMHRVFGLENFRT